MIPSPSSAVASPGANARGRGAGRPDDEGGERGEIDDAFESGERLLKRLEWTVLRRLDGLLTENQLMLGVKLARVFDLYGEVLYLAPGHADREAGLGHQPGGVGGGGLL